MQQQKQQKEMIGLVKNGKTLDTDQVQMGMVIFDNHISSSTLKALFFIAHRIFKRVLLEENVCGNGKKGYMRF